MAMNTVSRQCMKVTVDFDRMHAWLLPVDGTDVLQVNAPVINMALESAEVAVDDTVVQRINDYLNQIAKTHRLPRKKYLIAEARQPVEGTDGRLELSSKLTGPIEQAGHEFGGAGSTFLSAGLVEPDTPIGRIVAAVKGVAGADVRGNPLPPCCMGRSVELGDNVRLADDGKTVIAMPAGQVIYQDRTVSVREAQVISGDASPETDDIEADRHVCVSGTIRDGARAKSSRSITVGCAIEAAEVRSDDTVFVHGGIISKQKGTVRAKRSVFAKFCEEADVYSEGDIHIVKESVNSTLHAEGKLSTCGAIIGGQTYARGGIEADTLGNDSYVATPIRVGISDKNLWRWREIEADVEKKSQAAAHIRRHVEPLMANLKRLSPKQKEQATELIFKADEMDAEIAALREEQQQMRGDDGGDGVSAFVHAHIYPGVTITIGNREVRFQRERKGPVRIERQKVKGVDEIVSVDPETHDAMVLMSSQIEIQKPEDL